MYMCICVLSLKRNKNPTPEEKENVLVALTNDGYLKVMSADTGHVLRSVFLSTITKYRYVSASKPYCQYTETSAACFDIKNCVVY